MSSSRPAASPSVLARRRSSPAPLGAQPLRQESVGTGSRPDRTDRPLPPVQGALALDIPPVGLPVPGRPDLRLVDNGPSGPPPVYRWADRFVHAVVEVIAGDRPLQQLVRWTDEHVYGDLSYRTDLLSQVSTTDLRRRVGRAHVRSVHVSQPAEDVAEVSAHIRHGDRSRAIAARLETRRGRWVCTALQFC